MRNNQTPDVLSQALADPSRREILENLRLGQRTVSQLVEATGLKQPNVSNHLAKLRLQGVVHDQRVGRQVFYSLSTPFAELLLRTLEVAANTEAAIKTGSSGSRPDTMRISSNTPSEIQSEIRSEVENLEQEDDLSEGSVTQADAIQPVDQPASQDEFEDISNAPPMLLESRLAYHRAILAGDEDQAVHIVNTLLAQRLSMETIYTGIFQWSINQIGDMYVRGETDEAHEHMASAITERMMARVAIFYTPVIRGTYRALLGCVAGNWHTIGLRMLGDGLRNMGWETIFLGANVPTHSFLTMAGAVRPDLIVISCAMEDQMQTTVELVQHLDALRHSETESRIDFHLVVGGQYFYNNPVRLGEFPVDFRAADMGQFMHEVQTKFPVNRTHPSR